MTKTTGEKEGDFFDKVYANCDLVNNAIVHPVRPPREGDWVDFGMRLFGDLAGKHILELGCGAGITTVKMALSGAMVTAFDASQNGVDQTRALAEKMGVLERINTFKMLAEDIDFQAETFDGIFGSLVLHHISDLDYVSRKCSRLLKPGGKSVFCENSDRNPLARFARQVLVGNLGFRRQGTEDERQLSANDIRLFGQHFSLTKVFFPQFVFFHELARVGPLKTERMELVLNGLDRFVWHVAPFLRAYSVLQVIEFTK
jgi:2-polyprenyl-3-methyl-5-hydroxy-6-metoxy-1,4-benzoquinol methylase